MNPMVATQLVGQAEKRMVNRLEWRGVTAHEQLREWADKFVREVAVEDVPEAGEDEILHAISCITAIAGLNNSDWVGFIRKMRPGLCELADRANRGELTYNEALLQLKDADPDVALFEELMKTSGLSQK